MSAMLRSKLYRDYRKAFTRATGLPLELAPDEMKVRRPMTVKAAPFCALMAKANASCAACYALQRELEGKAQLEAKTVKCFAGLCETEVPVRVGENLIAFLHTGHVFVDRPDKARFNRDGSRAAIPCSRPADVWRPLHTLNQLIRLIRSRLEI